MTEEEKILSIERNGGRILKRYKKENITLAMCKAAVKDTGYAIQFVPSELRNVELYTEACRTWGYALAFMPKDWKTEAVCMDAVKNAGSALTYVPEKFLSHELCLEAVSNDISALQIMPVRLITAEFIVDMVNRIGIESIKKIPAERKTPQFSLELIRALPEAIWLLPKRCRTQEVCELYIGQLGFCSIYDAIGKMPEIFFLLPEKMYTHELCMSFAISSMMDYCNQDDNDSSMLTFKGISIKITKLTKWRDVADAIVLRLHSVLPFMPKKYYDDRFLALVLEGDPSSYKDIPENMRSENLSNIAFNLEKDNFRYLPEAYITEKECFAAISFNGNLLKYVPQKILSRAMCLEAVRDKDFVDFRIIPKEYLDYEMYYEALKSGVINLYPIPDELITYEMCWSYVKSERKDYWYIPSRFFTEELQDVLLQHGISCYQFIPKSLRSKKTVNKMIEMIDDSILDEIPTKHLTQEICDIEFKKNYETLCFMEEKFITEEMLLTAVTKYPGIVATHFPLRLRNKDFIDKLIEINPNIEWHLKHRGVKTMDEKNS